MATIQFLAGNPRHKKARKVKRVKKVAAKKVAVKKVAKKASKGKKPSPAQIAARKKFAEMVRAKAAAKKGKKVSKKKVQRKKIRAKKNPRINIYAHGKSGKLYNKDGRGSVVAPTSREQILVNKELKRLDAKVRSNKASDKELQEFRKFQNLSQKGLAEIKKQQDEIKSMLKKGYKKVDADVFEADADVKGIEKKLSAQRKQSDSARKKNLIELLKKKTKKNKTKKAKKAKKSQQGEKTVAKRKKKASKKKVSKKVTKKAAPKRRKAARKGKARKHSKRRVVKFHLRGKRSKSLGIKIFKNPSVEAVLGIAPAELVGLGLGGFSYGLFNDLAKRYLPAKVASVIAKAGPVSGAVVPGAIGMLALYLNKRYPSKHSKHIDEVAKGIVASAVVAAASSLYEVGARSQVQKIIAPKAPAALPMAGYEDEMGYDDFGAEEEFGAVADEDFGEVSDEDFGEMTDEEFGDVEGEDDSSY